MQIEIIPTLEPVPEGCKLYTSCWTIMPVAFFGTNKLGTNGLRSHCKDCTSFRNATRPNFNQQMTRARQRRRAAGPLPAQHLMDQVWSAWGGCYSCGVEPTTSRMTIGHIQPLSRGGSNSIYNLAPQCWPCNQAQRAQTLTEWCPDDEDRIVSTHDDILNILSNPDR